MLTLVLLGLAVLFGVLGAYFSRIAGRTRHRDSEFRARAAPATATVTAINELDTNSPGFRVDVTGNDPGQGVGLPTYFFPVVAFTTGDGHPVEHQVRFGARPAPAKVGQSVQVLYDPSDPTEVMLAHGLATGRTNGWIMGCLGIGLIGFAVLLTLLWVLLEVVLDVPV